MIVTSVIVLERVIHRVTEKRNCRWDSRPGRPLSHSRLSRLISNCCKRIGAWTSNIRSMIGVTSLTFHVMWRHRSLDSRRSFLIGVVSFGTKPLSLTVSEIFNGECDAMVDMTFIRPVNKGEGHSFWYHFGTNRSLIYDAVNSNFCSRTHHLAKHSAQTTTDKRNTVSQAQSQGPNK